jgi:hypothetical protein
MQRFVAGRPGETEGKSMRLLQLLLAAVLAGAIAAVGTGCSRKETKADRKTAQEKALPERKVVTTDKAVKTAKEARKPTKPSAKAKKPRRKPAVTRVKPHGKNSRSAGTASSRTTRKTRSASARPQFHKAKT